MKKARAIICGVLAALMLAGCGGSGIGKYAVAEAGTPAWTRKTEDRVDKQEKKREEKLERCGLAEFEDAVRSVTEVWFGKAEHTELTHQVERFILAGGGVYGSVENWAIVQKVRNQGKLKSVIRRIWLPYEELCWSYPSLEGKKYIQPYYEAKRFFKMIADGRWNRSVQELKANAKGQELSDVEGMMKKLGLR